MGIVLALFIVSVLLYLWGYHRMNPVVVLILKMTASLLFLVFGAVAYFQGSRNDGLYVALIMTGLASGCAGDYILGLRRIKTQKFQEYLIYGMAMFLIGHISYIIAFGKYAKLSFYWVIAIALAFFLLMFFILKHSGIGFGKVKWACYGYLMISSLVLVYAVVNSVMIRSNRTMAAGIGTALFVLSDLFLCFCYFHRKSSLKMIKWMNIICYYGGQLLIALSIYYRI